MKFLFEWSLRPLLVFFLLGSVLLPHAYAQDASDSSSRKGKIRAAMLYYIVRFVKWPKSTLGDGLAICIVGDDSLNDYIEETFAQKEFSGVSAQINFLNLNEETSSKDCDLLYIGAQHDENEERRLSVGAAFTVSGEDTTSSDEAMIVLYEAKNKLKLRVNYNLVKERGYNISSELLAIADVRK